MHWNMYAKLLSHDIISTPSWLEAAPYYYFSSGAFLLLRSLDYSTKLLCFKKGPNTEIVLDPFFMWKSIYSELTQKIKDKWL